MRALIVTSFSDNIGDLAILHGMLAQLKPISEKITVHCSEPEKSSVFGPDAVYRGWLLPAFRSYPSYSALEILKGASAMAANFLSAALRTNLFRSQRMADVLKSDLIISTGGGFISSNCGLIRPYHDMLLAKLAGKKLVIYPQSIGPFRGPIDTNLSKLVLGMADLIMVREEKSKTCLESLGISNVHVTADAAFSFPLPEKSGRGKTVYICPRIWTKEYPDSGSRYISFVCDLATTLMEKGREVVILPTAEEDLVFQKRIGALQGARFVKKIHSPAAIAKILSEAEFLVSSRMHPIILGSLSGTPFFAMGWEFKLDEISSMLGSQSLRADRLDKHVKRRILEAMEDKELGARIEANMHKMREKSEGSADILKGYMEEWGLLPANCKA